MMASSSIPRSWRPRLLPLLFLSGINALQILPGPVANAENADGLSIAQEVLEGSVSSAPNYTVQSGDSLETIARRIGTTVACLEGANPQITDASVLCVGESLNIPDSNATISYAICPGDTLSSLAKQFGVSLVSLMQANSYISSLAVDQVISVPNVCSPGTQSDLFPCGDAFFELNSVSWATSGPVCTLHRNIADVLSFNSVFLFLWQ
jgi:LysM repeat protein